MGLTYNEFISFFLAPINNLKDAEKIKTGIYVNSEVFHTFYLIDQGILYRDEKRKSIKNSKNTMENRILLEFTSMGDGVHWVYAKALPEHLFWQFANLP
jgi:hypothetical protein